MYSALGRPKRMLLHLAVKFIGNRDLMRNSLLLAMALALVTPAVHAAPPSSEAPKVQRFVSQVKSYEANAYLIESSEGLVLVDGLMLQSDLPPLIGAIKASGKPLKGVFLTHPHVDHFGGLAPLFEAVGQAPLYATQRTADLVAQVNQRAFDQGWIQAFGDDYQKSAVTPDRIVKHEEVLSIAGMDFTVLDLGAMEADNNGALVLPAAKLAFVGDALLSSHVYYVGEGNSAETLLALDKLEAQLAGVELVHPGHGGTMDPARLIADNRQQIQAMREEVAKLIDATPDPKQRPDAALINASLDRLSRRFAAHSSYGFPLRVLIANFNFPGLLAEMRAERAAASH
ncbi:MBL fold metallo-hydrolase [Pseudomarimonas arenosa]|uniref:MBL fold metallo-hydrolase n=1 Tax=Pseudomarimonas arenosa TaxID=2774145 RepID=A0AAW3ZT71_9GAMM|nr:MBL fold metallo-hydrolase [Pseudomarimonas arenosa]MBD8528174.1 MBL fold metallo-hydrolase [Pseudomarimonas arenosa]